MAKNATAPNTRGDYEAQAQAWRKIAELLELEETETGQKNHVRHDRRSHFTGVAFFWGQQWKARKPSMEVRVCRDPRSVDTI